MIAVLRKNPVTTQLYEQALWFPDRNNKKDEAIEILFLRNESLTPIIIFSQSQPQNVFIKGIGICQ